MANAKLKYWKLNMKANKIVIFIILLILSSTAFAQIKAVWLPVWDFSSAEKIDHAIANCKKYGITHIIAQTRYRGDTMYVSNRRNKAYPNAEKPSYLLTNNFDPLQYLIDNAGEIKIFAWVTTFVITPHKLNNLDPEHIYFNQPEWITADFTNTKMNHETYEGAFLDPGLPEVQTYTKNVILDIAANYKIDGIQLDYIRYPDRYFGLNKAARKNYKEAVQFEDADSWLKWKEEQINKFVKSIYEEIKKISPELTLSAAVIANPDNAIERFSQNWFTWLENEYIDLVFPMAYTTSNAGLNGMYQVYPKNFQSKIVPGLRAWSPNNSYPVAHINDKIDITLKYDFAGIAFFSYSGMVKNNYFDKLKIKD